MDTSKVIKLASDHITSHVGHVFDVLEVSKPKTVTAALNLVKIISKLSPIVGNMIEFSIVDLLGGKKEYDGWGKWERQDPGFPDTVFVGKVKPQPGIEVKAWFPLSTEITARFKDSQNSFVDDNTYVALLTWLPENLIYGKPKLIDVCIVSGKSVAKARDDHYHNPPDYLVLEPEDTTARTSNLQQSNTNGYKFQGTPKQFNEAKKVVEGWGKDGHLYQPTKAYQDKLRGLIAYHPYRLDTNFAKIDRIVHSGIEEFKTRVLKTKLHGMTLKEWAGVMGNSDETVIQKALEKYLAIKDTPLP